MAFAYTTPVTGAGTVSCAGTTTVTGTGTAFAMLTGLGATSVQARVGGTITVGGVTKTIVAINSATSLITDTAFGTFAAQAFTVQTAVNQTGTDTMDLNLGSATGFSITNRGDLYRTFDCRGLDLNILGTLTVDSTVAQLRNDGSCNNAFTIAGSATGGELIISGRKTTASNAPFPYPGFDWLGLNGLKIMQLFSTNALYPAKLTLKDACIRFGADWLTTNANNHSRITTQGDTCWILNGKGTGTGQARLRQDNITKSIDFQAAKTYFGVWLNSPVEQFSLKGFTPVNTDGPEVGVATAVAVPIVFENYNSTYVVANYYPDSHIVGYGGSQILLKNNLKGSDIVLYSQSVSGSTYNVIQFSKVITGKATDSTGLTINDGYMYYQPTGTNPTGIRAKGQTVDITHPLTLQTQIFASGSATKEFIFAWGYKNNAGLLSTYNYFCTGQSKGAETQVVYSSRYGYDKQSLTVALSGNNEVTPTFVHTSLPTSSKVIATAQAITGVIFDFVNKTMNITGNLIYQQIYDAYQYALNQTANLFQADNCLTTDSTSNYVGWTIIVNTGVTVSTGSGNFTNLQAQNIVIVNSATMPYLFNAGGVLQPTGVLVPSTVLGVQDTYTGSGAITGIYQDSTGTSTVLELNPPSNGYSLCIFKADGTTKYFASNVNVGSYYVYFAPNEAGTYYLAAEKYGQKRTTDTLVLSGGNVWYNITDAEDVGITQTTLATVQAYTTLADTAQIYDVTANFRLTETGIKLGQLVTRDGTYLDFGNFNVKFKDDASAIVGVASGTITYKSIVVNESTKYNAMKATPPKTITPTDTEIINVLIEDANGDSQLSILGGDNLGYELWKVTTATATDNYATGTLLTTLATNALPYRFIGISGFDIVGRDVSSGVRRRTSMLKGTYNQAFYVGNQIQLATDAPQLIENNEKLSEVILKLDAKLDVAVSTRLEGSAYTNAPTTSQIWNAPTRTLTSAGESGATLAEIEASTILAKESTSQSVKTKVDSLNNADFTTTNNKIDAVKTKVDTLSNYNDAALVAKVDGKPSLYDMEGSTVLAKEGTSQNIKNKVDSLSNYDDAALVAKVDAKPSLSQIEGSTVLAKESTSQTIKTKVDTLSNTDLTNVNQDLTKIKQGINDASLLIPTNLT